MTIKVTKPSINLREKLSELDFDKVPFQKMPAGSVLQVVDYFHPYASSGISTTSSSFIATGIKVVVSPKKTNSKFVAWVTLNVDIDNFSIFRLNKDGVTTNTENNQHLIMMNNDITMNGHSQVNGMAGFIHTSLEPFEMEVAFRVYSTGTNTINTHGWGENRITIMEIAQ